MLKRLMAGLLMIGLLTSAASASPRKKRNRHSPARAKPAASSPLSAVERRMLLRDFDASAIKIELDHRFLTLFTLEELQAAAKERGIRQ